MPERQRRLSASSNVGRQLEPGEPDRRRPNSVDPNLKNDTTDEFIVGVDREIGAGFAVGANYIWRRYGNFYVDDRTASRPRRTTSR